MEAFKQVFQNKDINNLIVAFIIAISTFAFIYVVGEQLLNSIMNTGAYPWVWGQLWLQLIIWLVSILVATGISTFAKSK